MGSTYTGDECMGDFSIKVAYYAKGAYIGDFYIKVACYVKGAYIDNTCGKDIDIGYADIWDIDIKTFYVRDRNLMSGNGCICGLAYKPSEFSI